MKRVAFKTFGCRLNQAETAQIAAGFEAAGYEVVPGGQPSDVCVIHTCAITGRAEHTCLLFARALRRKPNPPVVVLAGCAVDIAGDALKERCGADLTAGRDAKFDIPGMLRERGEVSDQHPASGIRHPVSGLLSPATYHLSPVPCPLPPAPCLLPRFDDESWLTYVPIRLPEAMIIRKNLPPGADNETNCDEVQQDILGWLEAHLK